jgi:hypothetical protein
VRITLVDAIHRSIIDDLKILHGGQELNLRKVLRASEEGPMAALRRLRAKLDRSIAPYPVVIITELDVRADAEQDRELSFQFPLAMSPADRGEADARRLTARIESVEVQPLSRV